MIKKLIGKSRIFFTWTLLVAAVLFLCGCPEAEVEKDQENPDINGPQAVIGFSARAFSDRVELNWKIPTKKESKINHDIQGVLIVRSIEEQPLALPYRGQKFEVGDLVGRGEVVYMGGDEGFVDEGIEKGVVYYYEAFTFDEIPNYSESQILNSTPGSMIHGRFGHSQTLLDDGRVLIAGGIGFEGPLDNGEIFDPETNTFTEIVSEMRKTRFDHSATLLNDGRVLIAGGYEEGFLDTLMTGEIFDPSSEEFTFLEDRMSLGRATHTATLLSDGTVFIAGGTDGYNGYDSGEIFDPETLSFSEIEDKMPRSRFAHSANLVFIDGDQYVMLAGGFDGFETLPFAVFYNPNLNIFSSVTDDQESETPMIAGRLSHSGTTQLDGTVLIAGGFVGTVEAGDPTSSCEIFDPEGSAPFVSTGALNFPRSGHGHVALDDGRTLVIGGINPSLEILPSGEIYDPSTQTWSVIGDLHFSRTVPKATLLPNGNVLIAGGNDSAIIFDPMPVSVAEIFDFSTGEFSVIGQED